MFFGISQFAKFATLSTALVSAVPTNVGKRTPGGVSRSDCL
jgi:hypothetical protein